MQDLNAQQLAVVDFIHNGTGSLNLVARAGTGKTYTLVGAAVPAILEHENETIALMAYNKSAAVEFEQRLAKLGIANARVKTGTVHSFGFALWRRAAPKVKLDDDKVSKLIEPRRFESLVFQQFAGAIEKLVGYAKQHALGVNVPADDRKAWRKLITHYDLECSGHEEDIIEASIEIYMQSAGDIYQTIDFNDMILAPLLANVQTHTRYDWVLIDEAQDTNESRRLLALKLMKPNARCIAVGDPKQAIYGFTGADSNALDLIKGVLNSAELPLSITYRCPKAVVAEANRLVPDLMAHESAPEGTVRSVGALTGPEESPTAWFVSEAVSAADVGLCRNTKQLLEQAYKMIAKGIGCRVEGRDIGEGLVQLATKWKRVVTLGALVDNLEDYQAREVEKWTLRKNAARVQAVEDKVETMKVIIDHLLATGSTSVTDLVTHIRSLFGDTKPGEVARVFTFSTIHKAKGREWDRVFFLFRSETIPSKYAKQDWQLDQESNLEYVAITRAKKELVYVD